MASYLPLSQSLGSLLKLLKQATCDDRCQNDECRQNVAERRTSSKRRRTSNVELNEAQADVREELSCSTLD